MAISFAIDGITNSFAVSDNLEWIFQLMTFGLSTVKLVQREVGKTCGKTLQLLLPNSAVVGSCVYKVLNNGLLMGLDSTGAVTCGRADSSLAGGCLHATVTTLHWTSGHGALLPGNRVGKDDTGSVTTLHLVACRTFTRTLPLRNCASLLLL